MDVMREVSVASGFRRAKELRHDLASIYKHIGDVSSDINEPRLERFALALWSRIRGTTPTATVPTFETPPDERDRKWRTEANLEAKRTVLEAKPGELTGADLQKIARYSGWGGLSIDGVQDRIPKELVPETFGLIHEYYTPTAIADATPSSSWPWRSSSPRGARRRGAGGGCSKGERAYSPSVVKV